MACSLVGVRCQQSASFSFRSKSCPRQGYHPSPLSSAAVGNAPWHRASLVDPFHAKGDERCPAHAGCSCSVRRGSENWIFVRHFSTAGADEGTFINRLALDYLVLDEWRNTVTHPTAASTAKRPRLALGLLAGGQFLVVLNASSVNLALPDMNRDLHLTNALSVWVVSAYLLTFGGLLLLGGKLGDLVGRRRLLLIGAALFGVASLAAAAAPAGQVLVVARLIQGAAAAALAPTALSLLTTSFPDPRERRRAIGIWGAVASSGGAAGVLIGGTLTTVWGWRAVLALNVPIAAVILVLAPFALLPSIRAARLRLNVWTTALSFIGISAVIAGLTLGGEQDWLTPVPLAIIAVGVLALALFAWAERRAKNPLIPLHLLKRWPAVGGDIAILAAGFSLYPAMLVISLVLQTELQFSPIEAGLMLLPLSGATVVMALLTPRLIARWGSVRPTALGLTALTLSTGGIVVTIGFGSPVAALIPVVVLFGASLGLSITSATTLALSGASPQEAGAASGLLQTAQQMGGAIGVTVVSTVSAAVAQNLTGNGSPALDLGRAIGLAATAAVTLVGLAFALLGFANKSRQRTESEPDAVRSNVDRLKQPAV